MLIDLLILIYFLLFLVLAWRRLDWALYVLIFTLPSYLIRFDVFGVPATLLEGMILILSAVWLIKKLPITNYQLPITSKKFIWPVGLFLIAATISVFVSPDLRAAAGIWKAYFIEPVLFLLVFVDTIRTKKQVQAVIFALAFSLLAPGAMAIIQKFTGVLIPNPFWQAEATRRVTSVYGYPNAIGLYFAPVVTLLIAVATRKAFQLLGTSPLLPRQRRSGRVKVGVVSVLIAIGIASIIFAQSKGALLAIFFGLVFYALFWRGKRLFFAGVVIGTVVAVLLLPQLRSLGGAATVSGGGSLEVRVQQWSEAWAMFGTRPLFGAGLSGYQQAVAPFHEQEHIEIFMYPHNIILNFWSETGLLGLLAFIWIVIVFYKHSFKLPVTSYQLPVAAAMTTLLVHGLVDVPYFKNDLAVLFWLLVGLMIIGQTLARQDLAAVNSEK